jgi:hypothetical protein
VVVVGGDGGGHNKGSKVFVVAIYVNKLYKAR